MAQGVPAPTDLTSIPRQQQFPAVQENKQRRIPQLTRHCIVHTIDRLHSINTFRLAHPVTVLQPCHSGSYRTSAQQPIKMARSGHFSQKQIRFRFFRTTCGTDVEYCFSLWHSFLRLFQACIYYFFKGKLNYLVIRATFRHLNPNHNHMRVE